MEDSTKKAGNEKASEPGVVEEVLPNALFSIRLDDGRKIKANLAPVARHGALGAHLATVRNDPRRLMQDAGRRLAGSAGRRSDGGDAL